MRIGFTCSTFDLLHAGHVTMLKEARSNCDYLIAGLQVDPTLDRPEKNKPVQTIYERYAQLQAVKYVDEILVYESEQDLLNILTTQKINVRFVGEEYISKNFTGKDYCVGNSIEIFYNKRRHAFSSTELRQRIKNVDSDSINKIKELYGD